MLRQIKDAGRALREKRIGGKLLRGQSAHWNGIPSFDAPHVISAYRQDYQTQPGSIPK
jgi:hypothetical protein